MIDFLGYTTPEVPNLSLFFGWILDWAIRLHTNSERKLEYIFNLSPEISHVVRRYHNLLIFAFFAFS
jgi:hypothetical protein